MRDYAVLYVRKVEPGHRLSDETSRQLEEMKRSIVAAQVMVGLLDSETGHPAPVVEMARFFLSAVPIADWVQAYPLAVSAFAVDPARAVRKLRHYPPETLTGMLERSKGAITDEFISERVHYRMKYGFERVLEELLELRFHGSAYVGRITGEFRIPEYGNSQTGLYFTRVDGQVMTVLRDFGGLVDFRVDPEDTSNFVTIYCPPVKQGAEDCAVELIED